MQPIIIEPADPSLLKSHRQTLAQQHNCQEKPGTITDQ